MQRIRHLTLVSFVATGLAAAAAPSLGLAAGARASGQAAAVCGKKPLLPCDRLAVTGPIAAAAGVSFPLKVRGYANQKQGAPSPANEVVAWNTTLACKTTYALELGAEGSTPADLQDSVKAAFYKVFTVPTGAVTLPAGSNQAKMYWCAYLINAAKKRTYKAAFWTYTVLGHGGTPGGPGAP